MRATLLLASLAFAAGCGADECPTGELDADADAGCDCAGEEYQVYDNGEVCSCTDDGLVCEAPTTTA